MSTTRTYEELRNKLEEMAYDIGLKKRPDLETEAKKQTRAYNDAFWLQMKTGEITNALRKGGDGSGGYLVPDTYDRKLVTALSDENVFRKIATTFHTKTKTRIPRTESSTNAQWINENQPFSFGDVTFEEVVFDAYKIGLSTLISDELLEDSAIDLERYLAKSIGEAIGRAEEEAFVTGDGVGKPLGIIHQASVGAITENSGEINMDDMLDLFYSVKESYRNNAVWVMSEDAYIKLRKIRSYRGRPLWSGNFAKGEPVILFGKPVYICKSLDDIDPGTYPVLFGDFSYFWIGDHGKRTIKRLDERYANMGQVAFIAYQRVDAKLILPEAVKMLKVKE